MPTHHTSSSVKGKGKKRALPTPDKETSPQDGREGSTEQNDAEPQPARKAKKPKRAETRVCPVCDDTIPVRLLASHEIFELQRVEEICWTKWDEEELVPWEQVEELLNAAAGPSRRGAALKARRSLNAPSTSQSGGSSSRGTSSALLARVSKTVKQVQKHRRDRHAKLRELSKADLDRDEGIGNVCPVCQVRVTVDAMEAHIDACLTSTSAEMRASTGDPDDLAADGLEEYEIGGQTRIRIARAVDFRGAGYDVRNPRERDVDEEVDIDGDDQFGAIQFTEGDVIPVSGTGEENEDIRIDSDDEEERAGTSLRELVTQGKVVLQSQGGNKNAAVITTDSSQLGGLMCRICLEAYTEPTVSTGCWHTCCKECWLRCLGSTKHCPICKRITGASELRRIYL